MFRLQKVVDEINKGLTINEKSGQLISGWSPNNVRRVIFGWDYLILQYHITGGRFQRLIEVKNLQSSAVKDYELLTTNRTEKLKPVINSLVENRVCSNVEEIIFDISNYDGYAFVIDSNLTKLGGKGNIDSRFPRLRGIYRVESNYRQMAEFANNTKQPNTSLIEALKKNGVLVAPIYLSSNLEEEKWKKGSATRPQFYAFDTKLGEHFSKLREEFELQKREENLRELDRKRTSSLVKQNILPTIVLIRLIRETIEQADTVYKKAPVLSKSEWAKYFQHQNFLKGVGKEFRHLYSDGEESLITLIRKIDFGAIYQALMDSGVSDGIIDDVKYIETLFFDHLLTTKDTQYKRDTNKSSFEKSTATFKRAVVSLFNTLVKVVYFVLAEYLARNTPKYTMDFYNRFNQPLTDFVFTRSQIEYYNRTVSQDKYGYAKQCFDAIGGTEITVEQFDTKTKVNNLQAIMRAFLSLS